jgi:glutamate/tyrosine decarboxylase-like PLP-dependent enzyme
MNTLPYRTTLIAAAEFAIKHLENLSAAPVSATSTLEDLRRRLRKEFPDAPLAPEQVISDLVSDVEGGILGSAGGRFFAWAIGGSLPAALAADWLTSAWDQNAALYACAPAAAIVEEVAGEWLAEMLGLPRGSSFAFVTGCQMAHTTCLAAARWELLNRKGWDVGQNGLSGAPPITVFASNRHGSIERAVRLLGIGERNIVDLPLDESERVRPETLENQLESMRGRELIVVLQAGDLNTGAFDHYAELIPLAHRYSAWVHIDGAFGLWAAASDRHRHLLDGFQQADSWATDGHKWLNVPYDCGYAFVAHPAAHRASMSHRAPYLVHHNDARDEIDWNPEWSRRARGFATYAALRQLGKQGVEQMVDRCCEHARGLVAGIGRLPGAEVLWTPVLNQGLVRFLAPGDETTAQDHDRHTDEVIQGLLADGQAFFTGTTWHGMRAMRVSVLNWQTTAADVTAAIDAVNRCLGSDASSFNEIRF